MVLDLLIIAVYLSLAAAFVTIAFPVSWWPEITVVDLEAVDAIQAEDDGLVPG